MEAASLYQRFKDNLETIIILLDKGTDIRTMPYSTTMPLEVKLFTEVLTQVGLDLNIKTEGISAVNELYKAYKQQENAVLKAMERILNDKRASMKTPEGKILVKEMLIRRLEFFNETARSMMVMSNQTTLKSPIQHIHPHHREMLIHPPLK
ncbi:hypothetical protein I5M27_00730 [Adhaeribacter sp. BT258]|uniref:Uncharacterized protein n=1 Tax=Adhaeribacter terrigena TaxID=2793070 RepID=A0ABS1BWI9_9BACT|nr:hypothetical protein [Adhaeribacter terrigena]MBK0401485.1 hypothetical protein [Adhaeribacter terrigena]